MEITIYILSAMVFIFIMWALLAGANKKPKPKDNTAEVLPPLPTGYHYMWDDKKKEWIIEKR